MITRIVIDIHTPDPITPGKLYERVADILVSAARFDDCRIDGGHAYELPKLVDMVCPTCDGPKDACDCMPKMITKSIKDVLGMFPRGTPAREAAEKL